MKKWKLQMKKILNWKASCAVLLLLAGVVSALGAKPARLPVYYEDEIVTMVVVNENVLGVKRLSENS